MLVPILEEAFAGRVDVQMGSGYLNYINGYTAKTADALNFTMKEHLSRDRPTPWLTAYRLLCKRAVAMPELYHELAGLSQMVRSFQATTLVAPIPGTLDSRVRATQRSQVLYEAYLAARTGGSFLGYCRTHTIGKRGVTARTHGLGHAAGKDTMAVGVRFHFELLDLYHGEWASVFLPHGSRMAFYEPKPRIEYTRFFSGLMAYFLGLCYRPDSDAQEVLADDIYLAGNPFGKRVAKVKDFPGKLPALPMSAATALTYYVETAIEDFSRGSR